MSSNQPYQVGDVVNGYRWNGTTWEPVGSPSPGQQLGSTPPGGGDPVWKKWWFWAVVAFGALVVVVGAVSSAGGGQKTAAPTASADSSAAAASPSAEPVLPSDVASPTVTELPTESSAAPEPSTPEPGTPEPGTPEPGTPDASDWKPITISGSGSKVVKIDKPDDRAAIVTLTHNGESNFAVWSLDSSLDEIDLLVNTIGSYSGTVLMDEGADEISKRIKIEADGDWTMKIEDVTNAPTANTSLRGDGDAVFIYSGPAGVISAKATGDSNFAVWSYGTDSDLLFNEIAPFTGENVVSEGPLILAVEASARWTLTVTP